MTASVTHAPKKGNKKLLLIGAAALVGLCLICMVIGVIGSQSPSFKATQTAKAVVANVEVEKEDAAPASENTKAPFDTPEPTETKAPTNTPEPTDTPEPTATSTAAPQPVELTGTGDQIVDLSLPFDVGVVHAVYTGGGNFAITSYDVNNEMVDLLVNVIGAYDGHVALNFMDGEDAKRLEIMASGPWTLTIYPIAEEYMHQCQVPGPCTGSGDDVILFVGGKPDTAVFKHSGSSNFAVLSYGSGYPDLLINEIGAYEGTVMFSNGSVIMEIQADGAWEAQIEAR